MSKREIIAYAITHAGYTPKGKPIKGGPYEAQRDDPGTATTSLRDAWRVTASAYDREDLQESGVLADVRRVHPDARVVGIVRARPSKASAVEVLRELVAAATQLAGETPLPRANVVCSLSCFAEEVRRTRVALDRARAVLAASGPDPMPVVRAAMVRRDARAAHAREDASPAPRRQARLADAWRVFVDAERAEDDAVDAYRKAGGK